MGTKEAREALDEAVKALAAEVEANPGGPYDAGESPTIRKLRERVNVRHIEYERARADAAEQRAEAAERATSRRSWAAIGISILAFLAAAVSAGAGVWNATHP